VFLILAKQSVFLILAKDATGTGVAEEVTHVVMLGERGAHQG
jgi:hypothetical protein